MKLSTFNIALSFDHLRHPFTSIKKERAVPRLEKLLTGIFYIAFLPFGVLYLGSAFWKNRKITKLDPSEVKPLFTPTKSENKFIKRPGREVVGEFIAFFKKNINDEGIFRLSGSTSKQKDIEKSGKIQESNNVHDVANCFKRYVKRLELIDVGHREAFSSITAADKLEKEKIETLKEVIGELDDEKKELLETIIRFLGDVANNSENKMNAEALASMFAPNFINTDDISPMEVLTISAKLNSATKFLIEHQDKIFEKVERSDLSKPPTTDRLRSLTKDRPKIQ